MQFYEFFCSRYRSIASYVCDKLLNPLDVNSSKVVLFLMPLHLQLFYCQNFALLFCWISLGRDEPFGFLWIKLFTAINFICEQGTNLAALIFFTYFSWCNEHRGKKEHWSSVCMLTEGFAYAGSRRNSICSSSETDTKLIISQDHQKNTANQIIKQDED